jgi:putative flippase GtrA
MTLLERVFSQRAVVARLSRCFVVSVGTTLLSAAILVALASGAGVPAGPANVVAVLCGIGPSYAVNRRWVWGLNGRGDLVRETAPFWLMSIAGLVLSTIAVARAGSLTSSWSSAARSVALPLVNLSVFGALWLLQFAVLERVLFGTRANEADAAPKEYAA